jgi:hypothetical protein
MMFDICHVVYQEAEIITHGKCMHIQNMTTMFDNILSVSHGNTNFHQYCGQEKPMFLDIK